jgi:flagellar assembly protein FliH
LSSDRVAMTALSKTRAHSRFIPSEEIGAVAEWQFGSVGDSAPVIEQLPEPELVEPEEPEQVRLDRAWNEGHAAGLAQGHAEATLEGNQRLDDFVQGQGVETAHKLAELFLAMQDRLAQLEQDIARQILDLACGLARQVVRRELTVDAAALTPVIREALDMLVMDGKKAVVKLHPQDWEVLEASMKESFPLPTITWLIDPAVERGGCLVESGGTVIDGTLSKRWERAVAQLGLASAWVEPDDVA